MVRTSLSIIQTTISPVSCCFLSEMCTHKQMHIHVPSMTAPSSSSKPSILPSVATSTVVIPLEPVTVAVESVTAPASRIGQHTLSYWTCMLELTEMYLLVSISICNWRYGIHIHQNTMVDINIVLYCIHNYIKLA